MVALALSIILTHLVSGISSEWAYRNLGKPSFVSGRRRPSGKTGNLSVDPLFRNPPDVPSPFGKGVSGNSNTGALVTGLSCLMSGLVELVDHQPHRRNPVTYAGIAACGCNAATQARYSLG